MYLTYNNDMLFIDLGLFVHRLKATQYIRYVCVYIHVLCVLLFQLTVVGTHIPHCNVLYGFVCVIVAYKNRLYNITIICYGIYYL